MPENQLLTPEEVAKLLNVCTATLGNWRRSGKGPNFIAERKFCHARYRREDVEDWLEKSTHKHEEQSNAISNN